MKYKDSLAGITKYSNQKHFKSMYAMFDALAEDIPAMDGISLLSEVLSSFKDEFPLAPYLRIQTIKEVEKFMTHDLNGEKRPPTSCGYGISSKRTEFLQDNYDSFVSCYEHEDFDYHPVMHLQSKDEIRKKSKDTRSITVPQIHLYIVTIKYLGGWYKYHKCNRDNIAFGANGTSLYWTNHLQDFDPDKPVISTDLRKQDSRYSATFVAFMRYFLKSMTSPKSHEAIDWIFRVGYTSKTMIIPGGIMTTFRNGEPSGFPLTILMNSYYTRFLRLVTYIKHVKSRACDCEDVYSALGDDLIFQDCSNSTQEYADTCKVLNHEITGEVTPMMSMSYLSLSFIDHYGSLVPYYSNYDKAAGSLKYYNGTMDDYLGKLCSFRRLLYFSPPGSKSRKLLNSIERVISTLIKRGYDFGNKYESDQDIKLAVLGFQSSLRQGGKVGFKIDNMPKNTKKPVNTQQFVTQATHSKLATRVNKIAQNHGSINLEPEIKRIQTFAERMYFANEGVRLPRRTPQYSAALSRGGKKAVFNYEDLSYSSITMNVGDTDRCIHRTISREDAGIDGSIDFRWKDLTLTTERYKQVTRIFLGMPVYNVNHPYDYLCKPTLTKTSSTDAVLLEGGELVTGWSATYSCTFQGDINFVCGGPTGQFTFNVASGVPNSTQIHQVSCGPGANTVPISPNGGVVVPDSQFYISDLSGIPQIAFDFNKVWARIPPGLYLTKTDSIFDYTNLTAGAEMHDMASGVSVVTASCWLHSVGTAYSNGTLIGGLIQDSALGKSLHGEAAYQYLSSMKSMTGTTDLHTGMYTPWIPNQTSDNFFKKRGESFDTNVVIFAWKNVSVDGAVNEITIEPHIAYEYITTYDDNDKSYNKRRGVELLTMYQTQLVVGKHMFVDNESHVQRGVRMARNFARSPMVKDLIRKSAGSLIPA